MGVMTAAAMVALANKGKNPSTSRDPTTKFGRQQQNDQRRQRRVSRDDASSSSSPQSRSPAPVAAKIEPKDEPMTDATSQLTYQDFPLWSTAPDGHSYNTLRFKAPNNTLAIDIKQFPAPIKLNRKHPRVRHGDGIGVGLNASDIKWRPLKGADGRDVIGKDGKVVLAATIDGREITQAQYEKLKTGTTTKKEGDGDPPKKKSAAFKKKTRQVFTASDAIRQLRREERFPWLLEPSGADIPDTWVGKMTDQNEDGIYALFVAGPAGGFSFVPVKRCYDFVKSSTHAATMTSEEAEAKYQKSLKRNSLAVQFTSRAGGSMSAATLATLGVQDAQHRHTSRVKKEEDDVGDRLFDDDDNRKQDAAYEEMDFEEEHADDEDTMNPEDVDDDETKEAKDKIKREHVAANRTIDGHVDDASDNEAGGLTREGRKMKRTLGRLDKNFGSDDDDDEEKNPYASSEDEEDEEDILFGTAENSKQEQSNPSPRATPRPSKSSSGQSTPVKSALKPGSIHSSRGASPAATSSTLSGAAHVAKRAVSSPKKSASRAGSPIGNTSRAGSPLAGDSPSRAGSPVRDAGRTSTPANAAATSSRATSSIQSQPRPTLSPNPRPTPSAPPSNPVKKRKAPEDGGPPAAKSDTISTKKPKKEARAPFDGMLTDGPVIEFLRQHPSGVASKEIVNHFNEWLTKDERNKTVLTEIVKRVGKYEKIDGAYVVTLKAT
ncbi:uncharacterized protein EI90DRAFT_3072485 [Cantharellus anzutake]|uniref:uncharacterized protein n=1 Tax=Cantharellus anzutake TaxID=1750568 RepID=UPI001905F888|nr:uncharacterized protein EI90DRAFT_3086160 [Cantharellus anzutake]XP_038912349.1 uncharacterized protein EI90DRAFT_3072485 [Cantharellus anzutake]KAF8316506.1 hypothetical protein EI90DRAFT_3086160 [Cantharellus anzutake]KAF8325556.1 hypothetical protein EI90DRAFT_3072485 [Cantharellus anzutake]